ncbi:MAG: hypothetical protein ABSD56_08655 [Bryobacteraceae bacterium]
MSRLRSLLKTVFGPAKRKCEADLFWVRRRVILAMDLAAGQHLASPAEIPICFRAGTAEDLAGLTGPDHDYDDRTREIGRQRLAAGHTLTLGIHSGAVVFYAWLMYGQMDLFFESYIPISRDRVYSYKVFTVANCRGLKICPAYYGWIREELRRQGYRQMLAVTLASNRRSLRAHEKAGFHRLGGFLEFQVGHRFHYYVPAWLRRLVRTAADPAAASAAGAL